MRSTTHASDSPAKILIAEDSLTEGRHIAWQIAPLPRVLGVLFHPGQVGELIMPTKLFDNTIVETAEQALEFIGNILESNIDALMTTDPVGVITDVNQQMTALTGYAREELIGSAFKSFFYKEE